MNCTWGDEYFYLPLPSYACNTEHNCTLYAYVKILTANVIYDFICCVLSDKQIWAWNQPLPNALETDQVFVHLTEILVSDFSTGSDKGLFACYK